MIRRDYIMRIVQEMAQVLARVIALKNRQEYDQAMREIGAALRQLQDAPSGTTGEPSLDDWIALCHQHGPAASGLMTAIAQLLAEQGEMLSLQKQEKAAHRSNTLALGLTLDTLLSGETFVSAELLDRIDHLTDLLEFPHGWRRVETPARILRSTRSLRPGRGRPLRVAHNRRPRFRTGGARLLCTAGRVAG